MSSLIWIPWKDKRSSDSSDVSTTAASHSFGLPLTSVVELCFSITQRLGLESQFLSRESDLKPSRSTSRLAFSPYMTIQRILASMLSVMNQSLSSFMLSRFSLALFERIGRYQRYRPVNLRIRRKTPFGRKIQSFAKSKK